MKRFLFIILTLCTMLVSYAMNSFAWNYPLDIDPVEIRFKHGYSNGALSIKKNYSTTIPVPEYVLSPYRSGKFAYIKGAAPSVLVKFFTISPDPSIPLTIDAITATGTIIWNLQQKKVLFNGSGFSIGDSLNPSNYVTMNTVSGLSVPNYVYICSPIWNWRVVKVGETPYSYSMGNTTHSYYTILAIPDSTISPCIVPWTDVLDKACAWAGGATAAGGAATAITGGLYTFGFDYDITGSRHYSTGYSFDLSHFLNKGNGIYVDCDDMAMAVVSFSNSIGCNLSARYFGNWGSGNRLDHPVNCVDPIGNPGPTNSPIGGLNRIQNDCRLPSDGFTYHMYAYDSSSSKVWDATLKYDTGSDPDHVGGSNPGCGNTTTPTPIWTLPTNVLESTYKTNLFDPFPLWFQNQPPASGSVSFYAY